LKKRLTSSAFGEDAEMILQGGIFILSFRARFSNVIFPCRIDGDVARKPGVVARG
jgi:hypothetical protein